MSSEHELSSLERELADARKENSALMRRNVSLGAMNRAHSTNEGQLQLRIAQLETELTLREGIVGLRDELDAVRAVQVGLLAQRNWVLAERDELRATIARIEALLPEWRKRARASRNEGARVGYSQHAYELEAALRQP